MRMPRFETKEYRVYGPPGTGKTTWIVGQAMRAVELYGEDQVSLCSLTNTAVREVVGRDLTIDPDNVSTLHARCKRALMAPAPAESRVKDFIKDNPKWATTDGYSPCLPASLLRGVRDESGEDMSETVYAGGREISLYEKAQILRQQMVPRSEWPHDVRKWHSVWEGWCRDIGVMDFTGWLEAALEIRPLPSQQVVFVDEAQDHTPLQLAVIRAWNAKNCILVGDDDQNLYEWSGALPKAFFGKALPNDRELVLEQSFRVPQAVHEIALRWANRIRDRKKKVYRPRDFVGSVSRLEYSLLDTSYDRRLPPGMLEDPNKTYMILTTCGFMLSDMLEILKEKGIAFHNPYRKTNARWNPLDSPGQKINDYLAAKERPEKIWTGVEAASWASILKSRGVFKTGAKEEFISKCEQVANKPIPVEYIGDHFNPGVADQVMRQDLSVLRDLRKAGVPGSWGYALKVFSGSRDNWKPRVIVGTIHSVKGGEADNVYLFPELSPSGYLDYTGYNADRIYRLFYVGMTRARENLMLCQQSRPFRAVSWN